MTGKSLKYLCAILNSTLISWWVQKMAATTGMGLTEWTIVTVERIPVPVISAYEQEPFATLVDRILTGTATNQPMEATALDADINREVHALYGLTTGEVQAISQK